MFQNKYMMPTSVHIQETHKKRSDTIVDYLFPGYSTSFILLRRDIYSKIFSKHHIYRIDIFLSDGVIYVDLGILYRGSQYRWKTYSFHVNCENKGKLLQASYFVDLLINHGRPLMIIVSLINISCYP